MGTVVITDTLDAAGFDSPGSIAPGPNPMNGPIYVEGAEPGDALRVDIVAMTPTRTPAGPGRRWPAMWSIPIAFAGCRLGEGHLAHRPAGADGAAGTAAVAGLEHLVLPLEPMIGCFGVAPHTGQAFWTATSAENGGNMDYRGFGPGTSVWLPVSAPGALFFLGDCHAVQGDGEIVGTGIETTFDVEVRLSVEKGRRLIWPRGETAEDIFSVGNARPLEQALQHATTDMLNWLTSDYGLSKTAASHLMGQAVRYDVGNVFDPAYTMVCRVAKKWLPERR